MDVHDPQRGTHDMSRRAIAAVLSLLAALVMPATTPASAATCARTVSVDSVTAPEGTSDSQLTDFTFTVKTGGCSTEGVVSYDTVPGSAVPQVDYVPKADRLTWTKGDTSARRITIQVIPDNKPEKDKTFCVRLTPPPGGAIVVAPDSTGVGKIVDDDKANKLGLPLRGYVCDQ
jgi:hypothetical protein